jgi:adenylate cyclase
MERRLTAILAADVVGYSRLMGANEVGTLQSLQKHQAELIHPEITDRKGRVVKLTGDGILVEFPSVVNAVEAACSIQRAMPERNADVPEDRRIEFRVGINLGDVIVEGDDLFGDGVNVAARLEGVARPGGIAVSQAVRDHIGTKLDIVFEDRGDQPLKNIERPVRVFDIILDPLPAAQGSLAGGVGCVCEAKPSIAVLPFTNMSDDPTQEFFSDGIAEDIITDLSKISALFVVGRNTSFTYKNKSFQLPKVAAELGVKFLLEGSVRKAGSRVRVTAQLIDGDSGGHVWADRYDRDLTDIFAIQDEITTSIVDQLKVRLVPAEEKAICQSPTDNVEAYTLYLKGREFFHNLTKWFVELARQMFVKAVEVDPGFARAYAGIANCDARLAGSYGAALDVDEILATADKAIALDPGLAEAHAARGHALSNSNRWTEGEQAFEKALALDPNSFDANYLFARLCIKQDNRERAAELLIRALEVQPSDSQSAFLLNNVLRGLGRMEEAERYGRLGLKRAEEQLRAHPESSRPAQLGACVLARLGETERAREWIERALSIDPEDINCQYNAACVWAVLGEADKSFDQLEKWSQQAGADSGRWLEHDPDFDRLRDHPRYRAILDAVDRRHPANKADAANR